MASTKANTSINKEAEHTIFVYGTLRQGYANNDRVFVGKRGVRFLSAGKTVDKFALYAAGIPYVTRDKEVSTITGEVYVVDDAILAELDEMESHPSWYKREETVIDMENGMQSAAWVYFNEAPVGNLIESGDFKDA